MLFTELGGTVVVGLFINWMSARLEDFKKHLDRDDDHENTYLVLQDEVVDNTSNKDFRTYDIFELENFLSSIVDPIVYIIVEKEPSTAWNLPCVVLESKQTGEWYVFARERLALQGTGTGFRQAKELIKRLREARVSTTAWAVSKSILDEFEEGILLWDKLRDDLVPLSSSVNDQKDWKAIQEIAKELLFA